MEPISEPSPINPSQPSYEEEKKSDSSLTDSQITQVCRNIILASPMTRWVSSAKTSFDERCLPRLIELQNKTGVRTKSEETLLKTLETAYKRLNPRVITREAKPPKHSGSPQNFSTFPSPAKPSLSNEEKLYDLHFSNINNTEKPLLTYEKRELLEALLTVVQLQEHYKSDPVRLDQLNIIASKYKATLAGFGIHFPKDVPTLTRIDTLLKRKDI